MKRLTFRNGNGKAAVMINGGEYTGAVSDRLAAYEDTGLEPEEIKRSDVLMRSFIDLSRRHARTQSWMEKVMQADAEGRLLVLPCKDERLSGAIDLILKKYEDNRQRRWIYDPLAYTLYEIWKIVDSKTTNRRIEK